MMPQMVNLETVPLDTTSLSHKDLSGTIDPPACVVCKESATLGPGAQSARDVLMIAAKSVASQGVAHAKTGFVEVHNYAQRNPNGIRAISFCIALALLVFSLLGVVNVFEALFKPYQYLFSLYNIAFAGIIIVADGNPEWFSKYGDAQTKLFGAASFLANQAGRAAFYFYVGSINLFMLPESWLWKLIYLGMGSALCLNGALMLMDNAGCCCRRQQNKVETRGALLEVGP
jgi:hypothetical protein